MVDAVDLERLACLVGELRVDEDRSEGQLDRHRKALVERVLQIQGAVEQRQHEVVAMRLALRRKVRFPLIRLDHVAGLDASRREMKPDAQPAWVQDAVGQGTSRREVGVASAASAPTAANRRWPSEDERQREGARGSDEVVHCARSFIAARRATRSRPVIVATRLPLES